MTTRVLVPFSALVGIGILTAVAWTQQPGPAGQRGDGGGLPDLVGGLKQVDGCLGVETARTRSGKNVIFAWFENKKAVTRWYYAEMHQSVMDVFDTPDEEYGQPLAHVADDAGPIMVVASITMAEEPSFDGVQLPISQIAIELYEALPGGAFLAGRFAPDAARVPHMRNLAPADTSPDP